MKLTPVFDLLRNAFLTYFKRDNLVYLTKIAVAGIVLPILASLPLVGVGVASGLISSGTGFNLEKLLGVGIFGLVIMILIIVVAFWVQAVTIVAVSQAVKGQVLPVKDTFKVAWPRVGKFFAAGLLVGLVVAVGFLLLIIPGILFAVWFSFTNFEVVAGGKGIVESLKASKALVSGLFWPILGRYGIFLLAYIILQVLASAVPYGGALVLMLFAPFFVLLPYLLYEDVKRVKRQTA